MKTTLESMRYILTYTNYNGFRFRERYQFLNEALEKYDDVKDSAYSINLYCEQNITIQTKLK